jgi:YHS domain-containing protein
VGKDRRGDVDRAAYERLRRIDDGIVGGLRGSPRRSQEERRHERSPSQRHRTVEEETVMNFRSAVQVFALAVVVFVGTAVFAGDATTQPVERAKVCMMQDEIQTQPGIPHTYQGKTYYLCCPMCVNTFDGAPERYSKAHDPVSGQLVDKASAPVLGYRGRAYFFASDESRAAFEKEPDRHANAGGH